ncbi:MAG: hypothetical protein WC505_01815 [Patescibacteria group bacterium]
MSHKKLSITFIVILLVFAAAIAPMAIVRPVKKAVDVPDGTAREILHAVRTHFDHPAERMLVWRYQITEKGEWQGSDYYIVVGRTFFGIPLRKSAVYREGGIITIPSLEHDLIICGEEQCDRL